MITNEATSTRKLNPGLTSPKQHSKRREDSYQQQIGLKFDEESTEMLHL